MYIEITKREILVSIIIICIMLSLGFLINGAIDTNLNNAYQEYNTAAQITENAELFEYGMRTNIGNAFVYGDLVAVDPISIYDIPGQYAYIYKREEHYTMHTRTVTTTDSEGHTHTHTEYYWTWDYYDSWEWHCKELAFLGHVFDYNKIPLPGSVYYDTVQGFSRVRYVYYVCYPKYIGTLYTNIDDHTINNTRFYNKKTIEETIKYLESGKEKIIFWILWTLLITGMVIGFYYLDNRWLENERRRYY